MTTWVVGEVAEKAAVGCTERDKYQAELCLISRHGTTQALSTLCNPMLFNSMGSKKKETLVDLGVAGWVDWEVAGWGDSVAADWAD